MRTLFDIMPEVDNLLALEPEEVGGVILQILISAGPGEQSILNRNNFLLNGYGIEKYPRNKKNMLERVLMEGWVWLESEGLIAPDPTQSNGNWIFITRRGHQFGAPERFQGYRSTSILKKEVLHPLISEKVWSSYLRGDFDSAIFIAFKEVEVRVRDLSGQSADMVGTDLMRRAFGPPNGLLVPSHLPKAEQESLAHLFAGAIGWFKNPQSHRNVGMSQIDYAVQALMFASHLIYLAELGSV